MNTYQVIKARMTEFPNPVSVKEGECVECVEYSNAEGEWAGWVLCKTHDNAGWLPHQILKIEGSKGRVTEAYCAEEFDLEVGEVLYSDKEMNGWIWGYKKDHPQKYAWAPLNHIEPIE